MKEKYGDTIIVHGEYINNTTLLVHECTICGFEWETTPATLLRKSSKGCRECDKRSKTKSHEQYEMEIKKIWGDEITLNTNYVNVITNISFTHNLCGREWSTKPRQGLKGCKYCNRKNIGGRLSHSEYIERIKNIYKGEIEVLETYISSKVPIMHRHISCGHKWRILPQTLMNKGENDIGCAKCSHVAAGKSRAVTHEEHVSKVNVVHKGEVEVIGTYKHVDSEIEYRHKKCGHTWFTKPRTVTTGSGCPKCNNCFSKGEQRIDTWLKEKSFKYKRQQLMDGCRDEISLAFDFGLLVQNKIILIEYDGKQHFEPIDYFGGKERFEIQVRHDRIKNEYCEKNGIQLVRIKYTEYDNIESILQEVLLLQTNLFEKVISFYPNDYYSRN